MKHLKIALMAAIIAIGQTFAIPAFAQDYDDVAKERFYFGGGYLHAKADIPNNVGASATRTVNGQRIRATVGSINDSYNGFQLHAGYMATETLGLEVGYGQVSGELAKITAENLTTGASASASVDYKGTAPYIAFIARLPISDAFSITGKVGAAKYKQSATGQGITILEAEQTDLLLGIGAEYSLDDFAFRAGIARYSEDVNGFELSAIYRF